MTIDAPSRRRRIEDVASALFRERGYAATSIRDIARALDVQGASLYAHVSSKEGVLWAIVDRAATRFERAADDAERVAAGTGAAAERVAALIRAHVDVITSDPGAASVFAHEWRALGPERRADVAERRDAYEGRFRRAIEDGMTGGEFALTDPVVAAAYILSAVNALATWYRSDGRLTPDRIADHFVDLSVRALTESPR